MRILRPLFCFIISDSNSIPYPVLIVVANRICTPFAGGIYYSGYYLLFSSGTFFQVNAGGRIFIYYVNEVFKGNIFMLIDFLNTCGKFFMAKEAGPKTCWQSWNKCNPHTVVYMYWRVPSCIHLENVLIFITLHF